jgi:hypothetical protein
MPELGPGDGSGVVGPGPQGLGEHGGKGDLAENARRQRSSEYLAVLASLHDVGKNRVDWSQ